MPEYYAVGGMEREKRIDLFGREVPIDLTWSKGMIGVIPVFETEEDAKRYVGKTGFMIFTVNTEG